MATTRNLFRGSSFTNSSESGVSFTGGLSTSYGTDSSGKKYLIISSTGASGTVVFSTESFTGSSLTVVAAIKRGTGTIPEGNSLTAGGKTKNNFLPANVSTEVVEYRAELTGGVAGSSVTLQVPAGDAFEIHLVSLSVVSGSYSGKAFSGDSLNAIWEGEPDNSVAILNDSNPTPTSWWVNGIPLNSYAVGIDTLGNDRSSVPPMRQSSTTVPFRPGNIWHKSVTDVRTQQLGLWLLGAEPDGTIPSDMGARLKFQDNLRELQRNIWNPEEQIELKKKIWVRTAELEQANYPKSRYLDYGTMSLITLRNDNASFSSGLTPSMTGGARANTVLNFTLHDPFYYGVKQTVPLVQGTQSIFVPGDAKTYRVYVDATYPTTTSALTITINGRVFTIPVRTLKEGSLTVDSLNFSARMGSNDYTAENKITSTGDTFWLELDKGINTVTLSSPAGSSVSLSYESAWF